MYNQSTINTQSAYFTLITENPILDEKPQDALVDIRSNYTDTLFSFKQAVTVSAKEGLSIIALTDDLSQPSQLHRFLLEGSIEIPSKVYFNIIALTNSSQIYLESAINDEPKLLASPTRISIALPKPVLNIEQIFSMNYFSNLTQLNNSVKSHPYFELIIVDCGQLSIQLDEKKLTLDRQDSLLIYPNQKVQNTTTTDQDIAYLSLIFDLSTMPIQIQNKIFSLKNQLPYVSNQIKFLMNAKESPYGIDYIYQILHSVLLYMLAGPIEIETQTNTSMRENYESDILQSMISYIKENVEKPIQISDLVEEFSLSRSSIQKYFRKYTNETPKEHINTIKLEYSKELIRNSQMNLTEISKAVGYGSSQYFSRVFSEKYGLSPSSYAKSIVK